MMWEHNRDLNGALYLQSKFCILICSHLFQLVPRKTSALVLRAPIVLKSHLLRMCSFWQRRVCVEAGDLCIQEAAYLQSKHCVVEHHLIQPHRCA